MNVARHKSPTKGQTDYANRLYRELFAQGDIITRKLNKAQLAYFKQADVRIFKGRLVIPTLGADKAKIIKKDSLYQITREYGDEKKVRDIILPNGARIDQEIVRQFSELEKGQHLYIGTDKNRFRTRFGNLNDLTKYVSAFHKDYNKNEKEMDYLFRSIHIVEYNIQEIESKTNVKKSTGRSSRRRN